MSIRQNSYDTLRKVLWMAREESPRAPFPWRDKLYWWRRGFMAQSAVIYDFPNNSPTDYVNDYVRRHRAKHINPVPALFDHKLVLRSALLQHGFPQADTVAMIANGTVQLFPFSPDRRRWMTTAELEAWLLKEGGRFVLKPQSSTRGKGVALIESGDHGLVRRRGNRVSPFHVQGTGGVKLIERVLRQGEFWQRLNPSSANTIRVLTMWTPGDASAFIGAAVQRIGTADTAPTDNWSGGGICAPVDLATGRMGRGRMHPLKGNAAQPFYTHHPDTGAAIDGELLPHWADVKDTVLRACAALPLIRYAGWDVLVDDAGKPVIIEANHNSDVNLMQVHGGLLRLPEVRRFYESYNVI